MRGYCWRPEVHKLREYAGMTRKAALKHIVDGVRMGALPDRIIEAANTANARQGKRTGVSTGSLDSWYSSWVMARGDANQLLALLAPGHHKGTPWEQVWWLSDFFMFYRSWKRPTVEYAYREFSAWWHEKHANDAGMLAALPSVHAVRRVLSSVPVIVKERFRSTGSAWRSLNPFVRRDWTSLPVNAVWVGDGHCMKMTAFNPLTGNIFRPEVTLVMDAGQRFVVGWSLSLSENVIAVADALRYGMAQHGIPLIYYSDNGGGEKNRVLDADITGILPRLGVEHHTGIPGNPQGRGVIERANKGIPKDVALSFQTYCARDADKETVMMQQRIMQSAIKATHKGKELTKRQVKARDEIPTFEQLMAAIELEVRRYNNRPHSSLPRKEDGEYYSPAAYRRKLIKEQNVEIDFLSQEELHEMFRPEVTRKTFRGEIQLFNNIYYCMNWPQSTGMKSGSVTIFMTQTVSLSGGLTALISAMPSGTVTRLMPSLNQLSSKNWRNASEAALHGPRRKSKRRNASLLRLLRRSLSLILDLVWSVRRKRKKKNFISLHPSVTAI